MKKILLFLLLISSVAWGQQPQRLLYANNKDEVRNYPIARTFIIASDPNTTGARTQETFVLDLNDDSSPESDSVIVAIGGLRYKLVRPSSSVGVVASWDGIDDKPTSFPPSAHTHTISGVPWVQDSLNTRQKTLTLGSVLQYRKGDNTLGTLNKAAVFLDSVQNVNQTNAANLLSGSIPSGRFGVRTIAPTAISTTGATNGQVLKYSSALNAWVPKNDSLGSGSATWGGLGGTLSSQTDLQTALDAKAAAARTITAGTGLTGGGTLAADRTISIANDGVTNTKLATMANNTIKGNISGSTANPSDVSVLSLPISTAQQTEINKRIAHKTISEVRAFGSTDVTNNPRVYITDAGKEGEFRYDASDGTSTDNTGTVLVSGSYRFKRVVENNTYRADWFKVSGDAHTGLAIRRAVNVAITALATDSNAVVAIGKGRNTVDTTYIKVNVPKWKKLTILGEPGNIVDFYGPESGGSVFRNGPTATESDSAYTYGVIEIRGVNFYGGRNPVYAAENVSGGSRPIWLVNAQGVTISNCSFRNIYGSGMAIGWSRSVNVSNNTFENVYARQPNYLDQTGDAITIYAYIRNLVIAGNIMQVTNGLTGRCGISVDYHSDNITVTGNTIQGYERGIHIEGCTNAVVSSNAVTRSPIAGYSAFNTNVLWTNNIFDAKNRTNDAILSETATFFAYYDSLCTYRGNIINTWSGQSSTYLAKFWGVDLTIESNTFNPNRASAAVWGYGANQRNVYRGNTFRGGVNLVIESSEKNTVIGNHFFGGMVQANYSTDAYIADNILVPDVGANTVAEGIYAFTATRPYVINNTITSVLNWVIYNDSSVDGVFEGNTHLRKHSSATTGFFHATGISATGAKKTAPDRYNVIRDYISTAGTYYVGNTGTPTSY